MLIMETVKAIMTLGIRDKNLISIISRMLKATRQKQWSSQQRYSTRWNIIPSTGKCSIK